MSKTTKKLRIIDSVRTRGEKLWHFFSYDIWRMTEEEVTGAKQALVNIAKTIILSIRFFISDRLQEKASALTYNTMLALVPLLTLMLAISRGFGFQELIEKQLLQFFPGHEKLIRLTFGFVSNYLEQAKTGLFVGIGLVFLIWAVISLIRNIENVFNHIWQIKRSRSLFRQFTDYLSMILLLPIFMVLSSGLSFFISTSFKLPYFQFILDPLMLVAVRIAPFLITCLLFTLVYLVIPNTRVRFLNAFWAGLIAGIVFQIFQYFYINGQIWVAKYNAIYGSFAALPLLLLWIQLSWLICLYGAELAYASENIQNFNFERDSNRISRRYYDFIALLIATLVVKRFESTLPPISSEEITKVYRIPSKLTAQVLSKLSDIGIIIEVFTDKNKSHAWQPAMDINKITVGMLMERLDQDGTEDFRVDKEDLFNYEWRTLLSTRNERMSESSNTLLKDLQE